MIDQPPPTPGRQPVTQPFWTELLGNGYRRDSVGIERYGTELETHNGRDAGADAWDEWFDLGKYLKQLRMEHADALRILEAVYLWADTVGLLDATDDPPVNPEWDAMRAAIREYARTRIVPTEPVP